MVEAGARQPLGPHVAHEHVGLADQAEQGVEALRLLDVEADRALVAVEVDEFARHAGIAAALGHGAQQIAARRLDLDHVGAVVGQRAAADRPDHDRRHVDDADSVERAAHDLLPGLNSRSISPHSVPFLSAAQSLTLPSAAWFSPRTSIKSPTHSGWTSRAV